MSYKYGKDKEYEILEPVGKMILIKKFKPTRERHYGLIVVPHIKDKNTEIGVAIVEKLGSRMSSTDGIAVGDYIMYDYYSAFEDGNEYVIINSENAIMRLTKEEAEEITK